MTAVPGKLYLLRIFGQKNSPQYARRVNTSDWFVGLRMERPRHNIAYYSAQIPARKIWHIETCRKKSSLSAPELGQWDRASAMFPNIPKLVIRHFWHSRLLKTSATMRRTSVNYC